MNDLEMLFCLLGNSQHRLFILQWKFTRLLPWMIHFILAWLSAFHLYLEKIIRWDNWVVINGKINIYYCLIIPNLKLHIKYWLTLFLSHAMVYNRTSCDFNQPKRHLVLIGRVKSTETCEKLYLVLVLYKEEKLRFIPFQCLKIFKKHLQII